MIAGTLHEVARVLGADYQGEDLEFRGVTTDSRNVQQGQLYLALRGERFDGHEFARAAVQSGAVACVTDGPCEGDFPRLQVQDTRLALGDLARYWRSRFAVPVVGVTGSNGKTTVKEMIAAILGRRPPVLSTRGNLNNDIGVPLTLFGFSDEHRAAVIEMGANHHGEIDYLAGIAYPDVAVVTNAGPAHLEGFGDLEGVANAKGEIFKRLGHDGVAVINRDDRFYPLWVEFAGSRKRLSFGMSEEADFRAMRMDPGAQGGERFTLVTPVGEAQVELGLAGQHNITNALAAAAACHAAGMDLDEIVAGLEQLKPVPGRLQFMAGQGDSRICDDTYNANPLSLKAALDVLAEQDGIHWLVLGDMGELGPDSARLHRECGAMARESGVQRLFGFGPQCAGAVDAFGEGGQHFAGLDELIETLLAGLNGEHRVLVKGSRSMRMERVVKALTESAPKPLMTGS